MEVTKCNCSPVDNTLKVWLRVQYEVGGAYFWDPVTDGLFYYSEGTNTSSEEVSVSQSDIYYALGVWSARCGTEVYSDHIDY